MAKFNVRTARTAPGAAPIQTEVPAIPVPTYEGGIGFLRTPQAELFLLAAGAVDITADAFYEAGDARVTRFCELVRRVAITDPAWIADFLTWLRGPGNIRTASIVGAVEAARAMVAAEIPGSRGLVGEVLQRPDEPGEMIAYHLSRYGRALPKPIKRGIADATLRLYTERSLLKYDTTSHAVRFGDVLDLVHPALSTPAQGHLFKAALDRRHGRTEELGDHLPMLMANRQLRILAEQASRLLLDPGQLDQAGMTWEDVLSLLGSKVGKAELWTALIPTMGYMALLRNLRNFDEAGVPDEAVAPVIARLANPGAVLGSRQLPMRFLSAYRAAPSLRWAYPLERALDLSVGNIPVLADRTLILVDTSSSMDGLMSGRSELKRWDAATMFGLALARRCASADVVSFASGTKQFAAVPGESLLRSIERWQGTGFFMGGGTNTATAVRQHFTGHARVVILTDEQAAMNWGGDPGQSLPATTPLYTFNLAGYQQAHTQSDPYRITLGGLTDAMFPMIARIEQGRAGAWPWQS